MDRTTALSILIGAGVPALFVVVIGFIFSPLIGLVLLLAAVIVAGVIKSRHPQLLSALKKPKNDKGPIKPDPKGPNSISGRSSKRNYMMLVSINAANQQRIVVDSSPFTIGRDESSSYRLDYSMVSRHHLTITYNSSDNLCYAQDHSSNGTYLNSQLMRKGNRMPLHQGDAIQISGVIFSVEYLHY